MSLNRKNSFDFNQVYELKHDEVYEEFYLPVNFHMSYLDFCCNNLIVAKFFSSKNEPKYSFESTA